MWILFIYSCVRADTADSVWVAPVKPQIFRWKGTSGPGQPVRPICLARTTRRHAALCKDYNQHWLLTPTRLSSPLCSTQPPFSTKTFNTHLIPFCACILFFISLILLACIFLFFSCFFWFTRRHDGWPKNLLLVVLHVSNHWATLFTVLRPMCKVVVCSGR